MALNGHDDPRSRDEKQLIITKYDTYFQVNRYIYIERLCVSPLKAEFHFSYISIWDMSSRNNEIRKMFTFQVESKNLKSIRNMYGAQCMPGFILLLIRARQLEYVPSQKKITMKIVISEMVKRPTISNDDYWKMQMIVIFDV